MEHMPYVRQHLEDARRALAPVAALLQQLAIDADRAAVDATLANARANGVALDRVERMDLRRELPPPTDVVVANLMRPLLLSIVARLNERSPRAVILSGLLDEEADEAIAAYATLRERRRVSSRGWTSALLAR